MVFDLQTLLLLGLVLLAAAFVQGAAGFAFGMISMGLSVFIIDARTASIMMSPLAAANISITLWSVRRDLHARNIAPMIGGMLAGLPLGLAVLLGGSTGFIRISIAVLLVYVGISRLIGDGKKLRPLSRWWGLVAGLFGGIIGGATNIGGPPLIAYAARQPWPPAVFKATLLACFFVITVGKTAILLIEGSLDGPLIGAVIVLLPAIAVGSTAGIAMFNRVDGRTFGTAVSYLVIALGVLLLF